MNVSLSLSLSLSISLSLSLNFSFFPSFSLSLSPLLCLKSFHHSFHTPHLHNFFLVSFLRTRSQLTDSSTTNLSPEFWCLFPVPTWEWFWKRNGQEFDWDSCTRKGKDKWKGERDMWKERERETCEKEMWITQEKRIDWTSLLIPSLFSITYIRIHSFVWIHKLHLLWCHTVTIHLSLSLSCISWWFHGVFHFILSLSLSLSLLHFMVSSMSLHQKSFDRIRIDQVATCSESFFIDDLLVFSFQGIRNRSQKVNLLYLILWFDLLE